MATAVSAPPGSAGAPTSSPPGAAQRGGSRRRDRVITAEYEAELKKSFTKILIKESDVSNDVLTEAVDMVVSAVDKQKGSYDGAAKQVKEQMDKKFGPSWHCVVGEAFTYSGMYEMKHYMLMFYQGRIAILLWKK